MTDNIVLPIGTIATDDVNGVHYSLGKLAFGDNNTATMVSTMNPLPVTFGTSPAVTMTVAQIAAMTPEQVAALTLDTLSKLTAAQIGALTMPATFNGAKATTSTQTSVTAVTTGTATNISAENTARKKLYIHNDSTAILYLAFGAIPTTSSYSMIVQPNTGTMIDWTYQSVGGVWSAVNGSAKVTNFV